MKHLSIKTKISNDQGEFSVEGSLYESRPDADGFHSVKLKEGKAELKMKDKFCNGQSSCTKWKKGKFYPSDGLVGKIMEGYLEKSDDNYAYTGNFNEDGQLLIGESMGDTVVMDGTFNPKTGQLVLGVKEFFEIKNGSYEVQKRITGINETIDGYQVTTAGVAETPNEDIITIGKRSSLCDLGDFGNLIYQETRAEKFWGSTTANCKQLDRGIIIDKATGNVCGKE